MNKNTKEKLKRYQYQFKNKLTKEQEIEHGYFVISEILPAVALNELLKIFDTITIISDDKKK